MGSCCPLKAVFRDRQRVHSARACVVRAAVQFEAYCVCGFGCTVCAVPGVGRVHGCVCVAGGGGLGGGVAHWVCGRCVCECVCGVWRVACVLGVWCVCGVCVSVGVVGVVHLGRGRVGVWAGGVGGWFILRGGWWAWVGRRVGCVGGVWVVCEIDLWVVCVLFRVVRVLFRVVRVFRVL